MPLVGGVSNEDLADHPYRREGWDQGPPYDPEMAERLLEQAGWTDGDGDGIRERAGLEARFTLVVPRGGYVPGVAQGVFIQDQLRSVGVATEIRPLELFAADDAIRSGDFEAAIGRVDNTPSGILEKWLGETWEGRTQGRSAERALLAPFEYHDIEAVRLLHALHTEPDPDAQDTLYARINEILRRDMPVTFLFPMVENHVAHRRIRGFRQGWPSFLGNAEQLWIEEEHR